MYNGIVAEAHSLDRFKSKKPSQVSSRDAALHWLCSVRCPGRRKRSIGKADLWLKLSLTTLVIHGVLSTRFAIRRRSTYYTLSRKSRSAVSLHPRKRLILSVTV